MKYLLWFRQPVAALQILSPQKHVLMHLAPNDGYGQGSEQFSPYNPGWHSTTLESDRKWGITKMVLKSISVFGYYQFFFSIKPLAS